LKLMASVIFAQSAQTDLLEAWLFIAENNLNAADHILDTIEQEVSLLATQPLMGRTRPELGDSIRSWPTATPYILFYLVDGAGITVVRVLHHARDLRQIEF